MTATRNKHLIFLAGMAALWLVAAPVAYLLAGGAGIEGLSYAVALCTVPGLIALLIASPAGSGDRALTGMLVGMGLRLAVVLVATLLLRDARPDLQLREFHAWLILSYLATLALDTRLILAGERNGKTTAAPSP